jgi:hypothetical protein
VKRSILVFLVVVPGLLALLLLAAPPAGPADEKRNERFTGTVSFQRSVSHQEDLSDASAAIMDRSETVGSAFAQVVLEYYRSQDGIDYYRGVEVRGKGRLSHKYVRTIKPRDPDHGPGGTQTDTIECGPELNRDHLSVSLEIDRRSSMYALTCHLTGPACDDTMVFSNAQGEDIVVKGQFKQSLGGGFENHRGQTDGRTVAGTHRSGNATWTWNFSGRAPDAEAVIVPPEGYEDWLPRGGPDEETRGDVVTVKVRVHKKGDPGKESPRKALFRFELVDVSEEKGVCMNWPSEGKTARDLKIDASENPHLKVTDDDGQAAESEPDLKETKVAISCFDYGAFGRLKVTAVLDDGTEIAAHLEGDDAIQALALPRDLDGNRIADVWDRETGSSNKKPNVDDDADPEGDGHEGDGLTYFEEYRGFMENGRHLRTDPRQKDLFLCNKIGGRGKLGIEKFGRIAGIKTHGGLTPDEWPEDRIVNRNHSPGTHVVDQHGILIVRGDEGKNYSAAVRVSGSAGTGGTPKNYLRIEIDPDVLGSGYTSHYAALAVAHEIGHCCNLVHHGEGDEDWKIIGPSTDGATPPKAVSRIWDIDAAGNPIGEGRIIRTMWEPTMKLYVVPNRAHIYIGVRQGQHSGDTGCIMRYNCAEAYISFGGGRALFPDQEVTGDSLCESSDGTGVNAPDRPLPQAPRYGDAAPGKGNCKGSLCVNDRHH